jgi:hypothetical protein
MKSFLSIALVAVVAVAAEDVQDPSESLEAAPMTAAGVAVAEAADLARIKAHEAEGSHLHLPEEYEKLYSGAFDTLDSNHDGSVSLDELRAHMEGQVKQFHQANNSPDQVG